MTFKEEAKKWLFGVRDAGAIDANNGEDWSMSDAYVERALTSIINLVDKELPTKKEFETVKWGGDITSEEVKGHDNWSNHMGKGYNIAIDDMRAKLKGDK